MSVDYVRVVVEQAPAGSDGCPDCFGVGWIIEDPGGSLHDAPPMLPAKTCQRCHPGQHYGVATYRAEAA